MILRTMLMMGIATVLMAQPFDVRAHDHKPQHGGMVKEANGLVFELVATPAVLTVHVTDEQNKPVGTAGSTATITLIDSSTRVEVPVVPAGNNTLVAKGTFPVRKGMSAMLKVLVGGKEIALVRYTLR